jgi:hypothetical protein
MMRSPVAPRPFQTASQHERQTARKNARSGAHTAGSGSMSCARRAHLSENPAESYTGVWGRPVPVRAPSQGFTSAPWSTEKQVRAAHLG